MLVLHVLSIVKFISAWCMVNMIFIFSSACTTGTPSLTITGKTQKDLCQMPINRSYTVSEPCTMWTDMDMCRNAAKVETQSAPVEEA